LTVKERETYPATVSLFVYFSERRMFMDLFGSEHWFESESERAQREHNEGQEAGSEANILDQMGHNFIDSAFQSDEYNEGWENGVNNQPQDD
jgi:hypothetical protein